MLRIFQMVFSPRLTRPLFWALAAFAMLMALLPKPPGLPIDRFGDKFEHMLAFFVLTIVARLAWPGASRWKVGLRLSMLGLLIEVLQAIPVLHRDMDWHDWVADTLAIVLALAIGWLAKRLVLPGTA